MDMRGWIIVKAIIHGSIDGGLDMGAFTLRVQCEFSEDESICGVVDEICCRDTMGEIKYLLDYGCVGDEGVVNIHYNL